MKPPTKRARACSLLVGLAALTTNVAMAGPTTFDFEDGPYSKQPAPYGPYSGTDNFRIGNFEFSPGCHFDWVRKYRPGSNSLDSWLGFDTSGCYEEAGTGIGYNHNYLGPGGPTVASSTLFIQEANGNAFSLLSFMFASVDIDSGGLQVRSSKGGFFSTSAYDGLYAKHDFSAEPWTDVKWLEFKSIAPGVPVGFDNLVLNVHSIPEPAALGLLLLSGLCAGATHRRGTRRQGEPLQHC